MFAGWWGGPGSTASPAHASSSAHGSSGMSSKEAPQPHRRGQHKRGGKRTMEAHKVAARWACCLHIGTASSSTRAAAAAAAAAASLQQAHRVVPRAGQEAVSPNLVPVQAVHLRKGGEGGNCVARTHCNAAELILRPVQVCTTATLNKSLLGILAQQAVTRGGARAAPHCRTAPAA